MLKILITPGEPAGIGPDIVLQLAQHKLPAIPVVIADPELLLERARLLGLPIKLHAVNSPNSAKLQQPGNLAVWPLPLPAAVAPGQADVRNANYLLESLQLATRACLHGQAHALVTGPIQKSLINDAGIAFSGHTEYLAELTRSTPVMLLVAETLRVALVTTHLPLHQVAANITAERLTQVIQILQHDLQKYFAIQNPRITVAGLNPHAGEQGHLGREELDIIIPTLEKLRAQGIQLTGPLPADTLFTPPILAETDAVLAMYHDQGLPVLKYAGFGQAVNVTLGLPIIRTSVDHGTALTLAGTGQANAGSLLAAFNLANNLRKVE